MYEWVTDVIGRLSQLMSELLTMGKRKRGGTVIFNVRQRPSDDFVLSDISRFSTLLNQPFTRGSLLDIFKTHKAGHDGAVIMTFFDDDESTFRLRIHSRGNWLPIGPEFTSPERKGHGSRHHSAYLMSQLTNAPIVVISEERGTMSVFHKGEMLKFDRQALSDGLQLLKQKLLSLLYYELQSENPRAFLHFCSGKVTCAERILTTRCEFKKFNRAGFDAHLDWIEHCRRETLLQQYPPMYEKELNAEQRRLRILDIEADLLEPASEHTRYYMLGYGGKGLGGFVLDLDDEERDVILRHVFLPRSMLHTGLFARLLVEILKLEQFHQAYENFFLPMTTAKSTALSRILAETDVNMDIPTSIHQDRRYMRVSQECGRWFDLVALVTQPWRDDE